MNRAGRLWLVMVLNVGLLVALVAVGTATNSLGVWAEGVDYLADAAAIGVVLAAMRWERRPEATGRANRMAAAVNAGWLLVLSASVAVAAAVRLVNGAHRVHGLPVLIVSATAAATMTAGAFILGGDIDGDDGDDEALSMQAVLLDTLADAAAAAGVAVSGLIIWLTHRWFWLDPAVALAISIVVIFHALRLLKRTRRRNAHD